MPTAHRIDVHHHILPSLYVDALDRIGQSPSGRASLPTWSQDAALALMDRQGIATAIASISSPGVYLGDAAFARDLARQCNEFLAELVREHPQRFGALAILPLPDVDAALQEFEYALDILKLNGAILLASYGDPYLGDRALDPVFAELNCRQCVVLLHPITPPGSDALKLNLPSFLVEFVFDTTRAIANLIYTATLEWYSNLSIVVSHAGGAVPCIAGRLAVAAELMPHLQEEAPQGAITYLKRLYDTAISATPYALRSLAALVEPSQILFGTDYPYLPENLIANEVSALETGRDLSAEAIDMKLQLMSAKQLGYVISR